MIKLSYLKPLTTCIICCCVYESPIILPCFETMCLKHVEEMRCAVDLSETIKCHFCNDQQLTRCIAVKTEKFPIHRGKIIAFMPLDHLC